ncbi:NTF2-like protein, partial [Rhizodiscina lignyota]
MAAEAAQMPINGAYAPHQAQSFATTEQNLAQHNANSANTTNYTAPSTSPPSNAASGNPEISKEEVGWYFVERYYTTLSKTPDKLFLFYNKRSQSVFGVEEEKAPICVGQRAINDRMKELDFQDCKVRVTNVDSQASGSDIVIQVIGEISNKSAPHRKFVQTFVLAAQTNGYFVLNDIFRYIAEEEEPVDQPVEQEEVQGSSAPTAVSGYQEPVPTAGDTEPKGLTSSAETDEQEHDATIVDEELEKVVQDDEEEKEPAPSAQVNGTP